MGKEWDYVTHTCKNKNCRQAFIDKDSKGAQETPPTTKLCPTCKLKKVAKGAGSYLIGVAMAIGGKRPNSGRPKNVDRIKESHKQQVEKMMHSRKVLLAELHDPLIVGLFKKALLDALTVGKIQDKRDAMRILCDVFLKMPIPQIADDKAEAGDMLKELMDAYDKKISESDSEAE